MTHAISIRDTASARHHRAAPIRQSAHDLPRVFTRPAQEARPVFERHVQRGRDRLALLALLIFWRRFL